MAEIMFKHDQFLFYPFKVLQYFEGKFRSGLFGHPQFLGFYNYLVRKFQVLYLYDRSSDYALHDVSKHMVDFDYKKLFNKDQLQIEPLVNIGNLLRQSFITLRKLQVFQYYGNPVRVPVDNYMALLENMLFHLTRAYLKENPEFTDTYPFRNFKSNPGMGNFITG
jgi:hypothetical protein